MDLNRYLIDLSTVRAKLQVKCEVIVKKKLHRMRAMRDMEVCFRTSLHMTLPEPQRGEDPKPENYIGIMDLSPLKNFN